MIIAVSMSPAAPISGSTSTAAGRIDLLDLASRSETEWCRSRGSRKSKNMPPERWTKSIGGA